MFFGREDLIERLEGLFRKRTASLVTCRGRRRVGKSTLIERFAERAGARFIKIEGVKPQSRLDNAKELENFAAKLAAQTRCDSSVPDNWLNAFLRLDGQIRDEGRTVVLLDEISWMAHYDPLFAGTLKGVWDDRFKKHPNLVLVLCGSVSSWIKDNILDDGSFYGRRSLDIVVPELPVAECAKFWGAAAGRIDVREIADVLSVTGGIPRCLEEIDPGTSADENIRRLCFLPKSPLREDCLEQLEECGLVAGDEGLSPISRKPTREAVYRLADNYSRFYLRYVEPVKTVIDRNAFAFGSLNDLDGWETVKGLQFENLVLSNLNVLAGMMGLGRAQIVSAAPYRRAPSRDGRRKGVQIDLLVQTRRSICLVEIKRRREIGREVVEEMAGKVAALPRRRGVSIRTALVYEGHLAPIVEADGYFDAIVPFSRLLGSN